VKRLVIFLAVAVFLGVSLLIGRWLSAENAERGDILTLLRAQARGDDKAMLDELKCRDKACVATVRSNARTLRFGGEVKIVLSESGTAHTLHSKTKPTRVVWITSRHDLTTVQCVLVRRKGNAIAGTSVSLLRVSAPIPRESSCP
jgi:hypothetical protein